MRNRRVKWVTFYLVGLAFVGLMIMYLTMGCTEQGPLGTCTTAIRYTNNTSAVIKLIIDGVNYGYISPGNSKTAEVAPGRHTVETKWTDGTTACSVSYPIVEKCHTVGLSCSATR